MQTETDALRAENQRLRVIISALADKLVVIETELTSFAQKMNIVKASDYSNDKKNAGVNSSDNANDKNVDGVSNTNNSIEKNVDGVSNVIYSINKIINGDITTAYATDKKVDGDSSHADALPEKMNGVIPVNNTFPSSAGTLKTPQHYLVQNALRKLTVKSTVSGIFNSATILIQLYTHPRNSYKELRRLTGLSEDGLTKRIMAMKKRGLIVRTGFQQYTLTGTAQIIINEAMR